jgi:hypothetical protein
MPEIDPSQWDEVDRRGTYRLFVPKIRFFLVKDLLFQGKKYFSRKYGIFLQ